MSKPSTTLDQICFVISPIGEKGTETYTTFKEVLDFVITPAVEPAGYGITVLRADDINRAGSFINDILEYISGSHIVIADLTGQNANVFYELGVRHSISPRTILIAQDFEDIPSDLREYRTIIYGASAKEASDFKEKMSGYLDEIKKDPHRPDNPVLDRLEAVIGSRISDLQRENVDLRSQIENILKMGKKEAEVVRTKSMKTALSIRLDRVLKIMNAELQSIYVTFSREENGKRTTYEIPDRQGTFRPYFVKDNGTVLDFLYISGPHDEVDFVKELADIRVLMEQCSRGQNIHVSFIVVSGEDYSKQRDEIFGNFEKIKEFVTKVYRDHYCFELWDGPTLTQKENDLGIKLG